MSYRLFEVRPHHWVALMAACVAYSAPVAGETEYRDRPAAQREADRRNQKPTENHEMSIPPAEKCDNYWRAALAADERGECEKVDRYLALAATFETDAVEFAKQLRQHA